MEFLGIGYQELLLVLVLLLVVVGPERLPGVAYQLGKAVRTLQQYARAVRDEFSDEISYVEEQYKVIKGEVDTAKVTLREEQAKMNAEMREATEPIRLATQELAKEPESSTAAAAAGLDESAESQPADGDAPPPLLF